MSEAEGVEWKGRTFGAMSNTCVNEVLVNPKYLLKQEECNWIWKGIGSSAMATFLGDSLRRSETSGTDRQMVL